MMSAARAVATGVRALPARAPATVGAFGRAGGGAAKAGRRLPAALINAVGTTSRAGGVPRAARVGAVRAYAGHHESEADFNKKYGAGWNMSRSAA